MTFDSIWHWILFMTGGLLLKAGRWQRAVWVLERAVGLNPDHALSHNSRATALLKLGRWEEAAAAFHCAINLNPTNAESQANLAIALLKLGRWEEAAAAFRCAINLNPTNAESQANLVVTLLHLARWDEAIVVCQRAIEDDPDRASLHEHLGIALLNLERWEPAVSAFRRAIALSPQSADANSLLGLALVRLAHWDEAVDAFHRAIGLDPTSAQLHANLGGALGRLARWDEAADARHRAIELDPTSAQLHADLGDVLIQLERWEEAAMAFQESVSLDPDYAEGYVSLANILGRTPGSEEGVLADERAVARAPHDAAAHLRLGIGLRKLERWAAAAAALERGGSLMPVDSVFQYLRVYPLVRLGRGEEAVAAHRRANAFAGGRPWLDGEPPATRFERRRSSFWSRQNLGAEVFRIERWLARLAAPSQSPSSPSPSAPRLLFLLDEDYGELTTLMYLVLGQPLYAQTTLLVSERLFEKNSDALPVRTHQYASVDDVLQVVDRERSDIVFLCSGYLLSIHRLFSLEELERLVHGLRERSCRLVTADPFLGMLSKQDPRNLVSIEIPERIYRDPAMQNVVQAKKREEERLWTDFTACEKIFRATYHLYPAYCDVPRQLVTDTDARNLSFFNAKLICPELVPRERGSAASADSDRPHWLFTLSRTDYDAQQLYEKPTVFIDIVAEKLLETLAAGRHPILIAPNDMMEALAHRMPTSEGVDLLSYCSFDRFMALLLSAEYAFYWNVLSHSLLMRTFNKLPTIVFDRGHLVRNVPAMYERVIQWYYQGWEPTLVSHRESLTLESVSEWAEPYLRNADRICERFRRAPTPEEMIHTILSHDPMPAPSKEGSSNFAR